MRKGFCVVVVCTLSLVLGGCLHHTFTVGKGAPDGKLVYKNWHHHWLFGTIRPEHQKDLVLEEVCPSGDATIYEKTSFVNGLIDVLVGIIYSPTTVTILCHDGSQAEVELSDEEAAQLVRDPRFLEVVAEEVPQRLAEARSAFASAVAAGP